MTGTRLFVSLNSSQLFAGTGVTVAEYYHLFFSVLLTRCTFYSKVCGAF